MITPSAILPTAPACSGVPTPKTAAGTWDSDRTAETSSASSGGSSRRSPVTPLTETTYTNPSALVQIRARRSAGVVGETSGTSAMPRALTASRSPPASSIGRSGTIVPAAPAPASISEYSSIPRARITFV